jgi:hypothetical protein
VECQPWVALGLLSKWLSKLVSTLQSHDQFLTSCGEVSPLTASRLGFESRAKQCVSNGSTLALIQFSEATTGAVVCPITRGSWPSVVRNVVSMPTMRA